MNDRLRQLQEKLAAEDIDALLVTQPANRRYLSGFDGTSGVLLVGREKAFLVTDFRYLEQAEKQAPHCKLCPWKDDLPKSLAPLVEAERWQKIGFEEKHLTCAAYRELAAGISTELVGRDGLVEDLRLIKSESELAILRRGAACLDRAFEHICKFIRPGLTEQAVSLELEYRLRCLGAEGISFRYIVASGERGAMPHGVASPKTLSAGELVTMDFGAVFDGYNTDMTRTVALGEPDARQRQIYETVRAAQQKALLGIKPGMTGKEADALAREPIKEAGFGEYFGHGLGHGVGLDYHEQPVLSPRSETILAPGMVVTVEPGIYIPGWGGVRIEEMVLITAQGAEMLTLSTRELAVI